MNDERNNRYMNEERNSRYMGDDRNGFDGPKERDGGYDIEKDRRMFSRKKSCWFCAKKSDPDWKDSSSYNWLINEFGKISPARITGLCAIHQRKATSAIKRGRNIGLISYISNNGAY